MVKHKIKYDPRKNFYLTLLLFSDFKELNKYNKKTLKGEEEVEALFVYSKYKNKLGDVLIHKDTSFSSTIHESLHACFYYFKTLKLDIEEEEEYYCSVIEYLVGQIYPITGFKNSPDPEKEFLNSEEDYNFP